LTIGPGIFANAGEKLHVQLEVVVRRRRQAYRFERWPCGSFLDRRPSARTASSIDSIITRPTDVPWSGMTTRRAKAITAISTVTTNVITFGVLKSWLMISFETSIRRAMAVILKKDLSVGIKEVRESAQEFVEAWRHAEQGQPVDQPI
jgi:hypothetical protein